MSTFFKALIIGVGAFIVAIIIKEILKDQREKEIVERIRANGG
jgi:hypothetical protein